MKLPEGYVNGVAPKKSTAKGGTGQRLLEKMGWQDGEGLGKDNQGRNAPVNVVKKHDQVGLGGKRGRDWTDYASKAFESGIASVKDMGCDASSSSDSSDDENDAIALACAGVETFEAKLARDLMKGNNLGRFGARAGKMGRIQQQEAELATQVIPSTQKVAQVVSMKGKNKEDTNCVPPKVIVIGEAEAAPLEPPRPQPSSWWGHKSFVSSGWLSSLEKKQKSETANFTCKLQEEIYNNAMSGQSKGKKGMGRSSNIGSQWAGKKMTFDEENEDISIQVRTVEERGSDPCPEGYHAETVVEQEEEKKPLKLFKAARKILLESKKQRCKRSLLEKRLSVALSVSKTVVSKKLQKRIDAARFIEDRNWIKVAS